MEREDWNEEEEEDHLKIKISKRGEIISMENGIKVIGFESNEVENRRFSSLLLPPFKEHYETLIAEYFTQNLHESILSKSTLIEMEHKDKKVISLNLVISKCNQDNEESLIAKMSKYELVQSVITINRDGMILSCNELDSIFGYSSHDLTHKPISLVLPYYNHLDPIHSTNHSSSDSSEIVNTIGKKSNGDFIWISLQKSIIKVAHFELTSLQLFKIQPNIEGIFTLNKDQVIVSCNSNATQSLFGYKTQELNGYHFSDLITKKNLIIFKPEEKNDNDAKGESISTQKKQEPCLDCISEPVRTNFRHKDGTQVSVYLQAFPFQREVMYSNSLTPILESFYSLRLSRIPLGSLPNCRVEDYLLLETIGSGSSGKVKRAVNIKTREEVAIKILAKKKLSELDIERANRETQIMLKLHHPHIVAFHHVIETPSKFYLVMELVSGIDLMKFVLQHSGLSESATKEIFIQLISALQYCHNMKVIHRDVKHKNIIIQQSNQIKLIDFGLSNWNEEGTLKSSYCGTPAFASPEMILGNKYEGKLVDVWSAGVVLYSMLTCKFPFSNVGELLSGKFEDPTGVSSECCEIIRMMLVVNPSERATLQAISDHPWCSSREKQVPKSEI
eukprot:TRINITY_DN8713_c0_g1_i1.p1 TRINITY_DN8713_c0_g1~~TRINITY_DN8713_c0_g1_i1.p1  ORF type:complete len:617 (+),score=193.97 TRINITY_DN8713_c0_g1_i1:510-2360(+)